MPTFASMQSQSHITLSELQTQIKEHLEAQFSAPVWVVAEIADLKTNRSSGHCYIELVEKGGANGVPRAQVRAVAWRVQWAMLSAHFRASAGTDLSVGMKVLLSVQVAYHELYGLSLVILDIDPTYTLGDLASQRQAIIDQLHADGVWDMNRETELTLVPQRIAIISSGGAAGYQDFMNELSAYQYAFRTELFEALMQGERAEETIIGAMESIAERAEEFDVVVIIRGGGSQSDLNFLNSYALASNVAQFPLPVLTGLGHDKDTSIVDMVAFMALKTPTAVARFLVQCAAEMDDALADFETAIRNRATQITAISDQRLASYATLISSQIRQTIVRQETSLTASQMLLSERLARLFTSANHRLALAETTLKAADPALILARGFAIVRHNEKVLRNPQELKNGDKLDITLAEGEVVAIRN